MHQNRTGARRNHLASETSPYLLQHADNPVDWYPWSAEALAKARAENKPILLSIGYSACHWCHVMAHESFEDPVTAEVMNRLFVNVKVDREERPDLDRIYQTAHQVLHQAGGGWPLTVFLAPQTQRPFFTGTYFPNEPRQGMPPFKLVLERVAEFYKTRAADLQDHGDKLVTVLGDLLPPPDRGSAPLSRAVLATAREALQREFDGRYGGFGQAPKFPHPMNMEFLLRTWRATAETDEPDLQALFMTTLTLTRMAEGGLYDQLGGGFCRYSVDPYWMIPHFEKMLYDNGQLLTVAAQCAVATGEDTFRRVTAETSDWMLREMEQPAGGFYSTLDADSEGHEGKFYVWDRDEVQNLLEPDEFAVFAARFGLDRTPNFEGRWHLHGFKSMAEVATELGLAEDAAAGLARQGARQAARFPQRARLAGARRKGHHQLERARDCGPGIGVASARRAAVRGGSCAGSRLPARARAGTSRGCWPCTRMDARASRRISTTTPSWPGASRSCCRRDGTPRRWRGPSNWPK